MIWWLIQDAVPILLLKSVNPEKVPYIWGARILMLLILLASFWMIKKAWKNRDLKQ